jgi:hypothetical protein
VGRAGQADDGALLGRFGGDFDLGQRHGAWMRQASDCACTSRGKLF